MKGKMGQGDRSRGEAQSPKWCATPRSLYGGSGCRGKGHKRVWERMMKEVRQEPPCSVLKMCDIEELRRMSQ
jgi:hypothetical protein